MKVFISHSGDRSKTLAGKMHWFVRMVLPATEPWISTGIEKGSRWEGDVARNLAETNVGIVCLTRENLTAQWLLFEAGALSKQLDGKVATLLLDIPDPTQIEQPLGQFQHTQAERQDVLSLIDTINKRVAEGGGKPRPDADLQDTFSRCWPDLEKTIAHLRANPPTDTAAPVRQTEDMLAELVGLTRANMQQAWRQEKTLKMLHDIYKSVLGHKAPSLAEFRERDNLRAGLLEEVTLSAQATVTDATPQRTDE